MNIKGEWDLSAVSRQNHVEYGKLRSGGLVLHLIC